MGIKRMGLKYEGVKESKTYNLFYENGSYRYAVHVVFINGRFDNCYIDHIETVAVSHLDRHEWDMFKEINSFIEKIESGEVLGTKTQSKLEKIYDGRKQDG